MHPSRPITTLPLSPSIRERLNAAGFYETRDLAGLDAVRLAKEAGLSREDALLTLKVALVDDRDDALKGSRSAIQVLDLEKKRGHGIVTFCQELDRALGGGVKRGQITEFCGVPGVGKTQLGMQLAVDAQIPVAFGGLDGDAIYVDTEGSFTADRCLDIARAVRRHLDSVATSQRDPEAQRVLVEASTSFEPEAVLGRIHYFRVHDHAEQLAVVAHLTAVLESNPKVVLVVIDSITFHFRVGFQDMARRSSVLAQMAQQLMATADRHDLAVVLMNQVTTRLSPSGGQAKLVPALGDSWGHCATSRVILFWQDAQAYAHLHKCPYLPSATVPYAVTAEGIRSRTKSARKRPLEGS